MKTEIVEEDNVKSRTYPWTGITATGGIVIFRSWAKGTIIHNGCSDNSYLVGSCYEDWAMEDFKSWSGTIKYSND